MYRLLLLCLTYNLTLDVGEQTIGETTGFRGISNSSIEDMVLGLAYNFCFTKFKDFTYQHYVIFGTFMELI